MVWIFNLYFDMNFFGHILKVLEKFGMQSLFIKIVYCSAYITAKRQQARMGIAVFLQKKKNNLTQCDPNMTVRVSDIWNYISRLYR